MLSCQRDHARTAEKLPTPGNFYVNLPPLFLGHFSPIFARFFPVFSPFSPSCPQDSGNRHQDPEKRSETVEKRWAKTPKFTLIFLGAGTRNRLPRRIDTRRVRSRRGLLWGRALLHAGAILCDPSMRSEPPELAGPPKRCLGALATVSWPWVLACGSLEPSRRGGENAQNTGKNGGKMGEIRPTIVLVKRVKGSGSPGTGIPERILMHGRDLRIEKCLPLGLVHGAPWVSEAAVRTASGKHHHPHGGHVGHVNRDDERCRA
eukprot:COSAG04_NODE_540_length_12878_cov_10.484858_7_plen_261_part_00